MAVHIVPVQPVFCCLKIDSVIFVKSLLSQYFFCVLKLLFLKPVLSLICSCLFFFRLFLFSHDPSVSFAYHADSAAGNMSAKRTSK